MIKISIDTFLKKKRFFCVFYDAVAQNGDVKKGSATFNTIKGQMFSKKDLENALILSNKFTACIISNFYEFKNEQDFNDFNS